MRKKSRPYFRTRKNIGPTHRMNVYVTQESFHKADMMAGADSLGAFVEELIQREYRRREKRIVQQRETSRKPEVIMSISA